eukprot:6207235-Pleurochrysis_carterae.AAC.2
MSPTSTCGDTHREKGFDSERGIAPAGGGGDLSNASENATALECAASLHQYRHMHTPSRA